MKKLSEKGYWDSIYKNSPKEKDDTVSAVTHCKNWLKRQTRDYSNYLIWENIYPKYLPKSETMKVIEIGCAPGKHIISMHKRYGYIPYGVEYSEAGCDITRDNFKKEGLPPENIIHADFLDKDFQEKNSHAYDVVVSLGFIEHFDDASGIVGDHIKLLSDKGYLVVLIPNLSGINYYLLKFLNPESLSGHNTSIMNKKSFEALFENKDLDHMYCDYIGLLSFGLLNTDKKWKYYLWRVLLIVQRPFDMLQRVLLGSHALKSRYSSPYLLYVGRKK